MGAESHAKRTTYPGSGPTRPTCLGNGQREARHWPCRASTAGRQPGAKGIDRPGAVPKREAILYIRAAAGARGSPLGLLSPESGLCYPSVSLYSRPLARTPAARRCVGLEPPPSPSPAFPPARPGTPGLGYPFSGLPTPIHLAEPPGSLLLGCRLLHPVLEHFPLGPHASTVDYHPVQVRTREPEEPWLRPSMYDQTQRATRPPSEPLLTSPFPPARTEPSTGRLPQQRPLSEFGNRSKGPTALPGAPGAIYQQTLWGGWELV